VKRRIFTPLLVALLQVCEVTGWDYGEAWIPCKDDTFLELSPAWYSSTVGAASVLALEHRL